MMKVIGVTGLQGSGKSIFFDTAKEKGALVVSMGDIIREKAAERGEDTGTTARTLREEFGQYIVAELTVQKIKELLEKEGDIKTILVDGIRSPYEIELFKENFENFIVLSVFSNPTLRFERLKIRQREDDCQDYEGFRKRDETELGFGIGNVISLSDKLIINESDLESYKEKINEFYTELGL